MSSSFRIQPLGCVPQLPDLTTLTFVHAKPYVIEKDEYQDIPSIRSGLVASFASYELQSLSKMISGSIDFKNARVNVYAKGDHFDWHDDRPRDMDSAKQSNTTVLLLPPKSFSPFEGGELCFHTDGSSFVDQTIRTNGFSQWMVVWFPHSTIHRVNPVISGERYSFKFNAFVEREATVNHHRRRRRIRTGSDSDEGRVTD